MAKYEKLIQNKVEKADELLDTVQEVRKTRGGAILDPDDLIVDVLDCNDFVSISMFLITQICVYIHDMCKSFAVFASDLVPPIGPIPEELKHILEPMYPLRFLRSRSSYAA